jgi:hypothetical protein
MIEGSTAKVLYKSSVNSIIADLSTWRIDSFIRELEKNKSKGRGLPFVGGLRLSSLLIYEIRDLLNGSKLTADWGHILDDDGNFCSKEADIIIHSGKYFKKWNGTHSPVMDFKFIQKEGAKIVISCKSYLKSSQIENEYYKEIKSYVERVWLFAECCGPKSIKNINKRCHEIGYEHFFHLYTWSGNQNICENYDGWFNFVEEIKKLR